ncbi:DUF523 and DUF1722 domain-containing protein [Ammoniphilus sp. CFH 90114]|uniref:YbgA family protein n=1 Tax=Ammoniphilus sp. CFH 90114 TaxID=2493665 RepID=UPI00100FB8AF|nr:DUF523 and DUF1722 domain-containing protein [Ammoniphilus sp. CFH 90114]RXT06385.1 DUF1722 domain-containing protein [Ammoniphilus sp. CFH 90114]
MELFEKPIVVVSKCLGYDACRYNGEMLEDPILEKLAPFIKVVTVCPEVEIGLGIPRDPIRIVDLSGGGVRLVQPATGKDYTEEMNRFSKDFFNSLEEVDGFILKSRSPSCAIRDAKIYSGLEKAPVIGKSGGLFGRFMMENLSHLAIEEDGRLKNYNIREHFFIKLFTLSKFRSFKKTLSLPLLIEFQSKNKYLFMAYHPSGQKRLGSIIANPKRKPITEVYVDYEKALYEVLSRPTSSGSNINVLQHIMGYFKKELSAKEKSFFLTLLDRYREQKVPLSSPLGVLKAWAVRFENEYLMKQTYFEPYPHSLIELLDSGKGRDLS